jgi:copper chaperone NosL
MKHRFLILLAGILLANAPLLCAQGKKVLKPGPKDKCPACGMFVAKYPEFVAVLTFKDGANAFFDGVKDMMRYYFNPQKYSPSRKREDVTLIHVTDYYSSSLVDGFKALYVVGSDIYGPMGKELIPFEKEEDAKEFLRDHKGKAVLRFQDINSDVMKWLD